MLCSGKVQIAEVLSPVNAPVLQEIQLFFHLVLTDIAENRRYGIQTQSPTSKKKFPEVLDSSPGKHGLLFILDPPAKNARAMREGEWDVGRRD